MSHKLRIALAQLNPKVGALAENLVLAEAALARAAAAGADILLLSELFLTGYFPEDLLLKPRFVKDAVAAAEALAVKTAGCGVSLLLPSIWPESGKLYNAVLLAENGRIAGRRLKHELPNDDVFYEKRYFAAGPLPEPLFIKGVSIGVPICEDIWHPPVCAYLAERGAELLLCPNGSPYWRDKQHIRKEVARARVAETGLPLAYLNQVGGQDELVFDGASFAMEPGDRLAVQAKSFEEDFVVSDWARAETGWRCAAGVVTPLASTNEAPWQAMLRGLRDYVKKNGFSKVVLGLSGGIDSAVVAAIAADALGPDNVHCVMLPYRYTSAASLRDAEACAAALGVRYDIVPIEAPVAAALGALQPLFAGTRPDVTEENIQSRLRGLVLMAISNKSGAMLLTTGNKSEMAVGYATIYGDMNGGYNPIKDLFKMEVYRLAGWRNAHIPVGTRCARGEIIPAAIIDRAPSAELRADQTDQDSLPPYAVLDEILAGLIEDEASVAEIVAAGAGRFDRDLVKRVEKLVLLAEHKRRQAAPGVKLSKKAFGTGRKYPITNGYRDDSGAVTG